MNQLRARLPPNQSPATPTGRRLQMASDGNAPAEAFRFQALAQEIAAELRAKFDLLRDRAQYEDRQGAWPRCADIDPAERGRVDRIGIPQRKKTGSPTAAMGH